MSELKEMKRQAIEVVERRAFESRFTMRAVCAKAGVTPQAWSGAKQRGSISVALLKSVEDALATLERERAA